MGIIHVLPLSVVNKIAAGEVIERPASVLKELIENALDAGATSLKIDLEEGGKQLIRIADDGGGFYAEDLPLAFAAHATSKLEKPEDLFRVSTLGFRGEALASIGSISHARLVSRRKGVLTGAEIECRGGDISPPKPAGCPEGTSIEVRNLFFNTPARRKFLRSAPVELGHCVDVATRFAISHCAVRVDLSHDRSAIFALPGNQDFKQRVEYFLGPELASSLLHMELRDGNTLLNAYFAPPYLARASAKMQYTFVNGRYIRERAVTRALAQGYKGFMPHDKYAVAILFITIDPSEVDVNVHPTKIEVRFRNVWRLHDMIVDTVRALLKRSEGAVPVVPAAPRATSGESDVALAGGAQPDVKTAILDFFLGPGGAKRQAEDATRQLPLQAPLAEPCSAPCSGADRSVSFVPKDAPLHGALHAPASVGRTPSVFPEYVAPRISVGEMRPCFQVHDSYIVEQVADGILVIDQHALHERILLCELHKRLESGKATRQRLLIPAVVEFSKAEMTCIKEILPHMAQLGFEVDEFGPNTVAVQAVPDILASVNPETILRGVVEGYEGGGSSEAAEKAVEEIMNLLACKAAIKAGDRLTHEEMVGLLRQRENVEQSATCAHGRPTTLKITLAELEKYFKRA